MSFFLKYSSWILAFLTICGFIKFYVYYKRLGIYIVPYLDLSEILTLFMDNLLAYIAIIAPATLVIFLISKKCLDPINSGNYLQVFKIYLSSLIIPTICFIILTVCILITKKFGSKISYREVWLQILFSFLLLYLFPYLVIVVKMFIKTLWEIEIPLRLAFLGGLSVVLIITSIAFAFNEAKKVKNQKGEIVKVELDNEVLEGNLVLLGVTKNYLFIYDSSSKTNLTIPNNRLKKIVSRSHY